MTLIQGPFRWSILFLLGAALLLLVAPLAAGFDSAALRLVPYGLGSLILAVLLAKGWRWLGYIGFFASFIAGIAAMTGIWANSPVPALWFTAIVAAFWLSAAALFVTLWKSRPQSPAP